MTAESIETSAVAALGMMQRIGEGMPDMHPMRHQVRALKREAYNALDEAFRRAHRLAYMAGDVVTDYDKAIKEIGVITPASTNPQTPAT